MSIVRATAVNSKVLLAALRLLANGFQCYETRDEGKYEMPVLLSLVKMAASPP